MKSRTWPAVVACALWILGSGCTALKEIPRGEYAAQPEREHVVVHTTQGLIYEFDYAQIHADSLLGFKRRDLEGSVADYASFGVPLSDIATLSTRGVDWKRTALIGGAVAAAVIAAGLAAKKNNNSQPEDSGGGGGRVP